MNLNPLHKTLVQWQDPTGVFHEPGEEGNYSAVVDLQDLLRIGTVTTITYPSAPTYTFEAKEVTTNAENE